MTNVVNSCCRNCNRGLMPDTKQWKIITQTQSGHIATFQIANNPIATNANRSSNTDYIPIYSKNPTPLEWQLDYTTDGVTLVLLKYFFTLQRCRTEAPTRQWIMLTLFACQEHLFIPCERAAASNSSDVPAAQWCASSFWDVVAQWTISLM